MVKDYDKILTRLISILSKLSNNELPTSKELADEFGVTTRTIQKDIYERLVNFPIEKTSQHQYKFIDGFSLDKSILNSDEMIILSLALSQFDQVSDFDKVTSRIYKKLVHANFNNPYFIKQDDIQDLDIDAKIVQLLEDAIQFANIIEIENNKGKFEVEPYKIANFDGIWYLFGKDLKDNKIKTFMIYKLKDVKLTNKKYKVSTHQIKQILNKTHSAWYDDGEAFEVKVKVYAKIADYFRQRDFLQSQKILEELNDGSLIVRFEVTHDEDIDNIIKSWLPHIEIIEPVRFREKIKKELEEYLLKI